MKNMKKLLAMFLTFAMLISVVAVFPASAAEAMDTAVFVVDENNVKDGGAAGTYTIADAVANVKDGGTITMSGDAISNDRVDLTGAGKSYTIDGTKTKDGTGNVTETYKWTNAATSTRSAVKLGGSGKTITLTNINFHSANRLQLLEIGDGQNVTVKLGEGVLFTAESGDTYKNAVIMFAHSNTLIVDGAVFNLDAPAITCWNGNTTTLIHKITLNKGTLSTDANGVAITGNTAGVPCYITLNGTKADVLVKDPTTGTSRALKAEDVSRTSLFYSVGANSDYVEFRSVTDVFSVDADNVKEGGTAGVYSLQSAVENVKDGGVIKMTGDITFTSRLNLRENQYYKSYTIDGAKADGTGNYTLTHSVPNNSAFVLGGNETTVTLKNMNIHTTTRRQVLETGAFSVNLVLGSGVKFTAATGTGYTNGVIMAGVGSTITLDGATIAVDAPAIANWGAGAHNVVLNSGTLSAGQNKGAIVDGWQTSNPCKIALNGQILVNDYNNNLVGDDARSLWNTDITAAAVEYTYSNNMSADDLMPPATEITIQGSETKYETLQAAVDAAETGATIVVSGSHNVTAATLIVGKDLTIKGVLANIIGGDHAILVLHNANVTIESLTLTCASKAQVGVVSMGDTTEGQVAYTGATLTLNSGAKLVNTQAGAGTNTGGNGVAVQLSGTTNIVMNAGSVVETGGTAIIGDISNGAANKAFNLTMNGGTITAANRGLTLASPGINVVINDGSITAKDWVFASYGHAVDVTVNNGTLTATGGSIFANVTSANGKYVINGGTLTSSADTAASSAANGTYVVNGGTIKAKNAVVFEDTAQAPEVTFSNNYMYLYIPTTAKTAVQAGLAFATKAAYTGNLQLTYGMLIGSKLLLNGAELNMAAANAAANAVAAARAIDDAELTANGYIDTAIVDLTSIIGLTEFVARAYACMKIDLGNGAIANTDIVVYGDVMEATTADFANAYVRDNPNYASNDVQKDIVEFLLNPVA